MADEIPLKPARRGLLLTTSMSFFAGIVDVVGFIALFGLFTSHFTGNFVVIGQELIHHSWKLVIQVIAIPVFIVVVAAMRLVVMSCERHAVSSFFVCLMVQIAMLAGCMALGLASSPITDPTAIGPIITAQLGVGAMAVQNAINRLIIPAFPATTVMTTNLTQFSIDLVDRFRSHGALREAARARFNRTGPVIAAFSLGVIFGAYALVAISFWCLVVPLAGLLVIAVMAAKGVFVHAPEPGHDHRVSGRPRSRKPRLQR